MSDNLPPYIYGRETGENERVYTEAAVAQMRERLQAQLEAAVAAERERCAKLCEGMHDEDRPSDYAWAIRTDWANVGGEAHAPEQN